MRIWILYIKSLSFPIRKVYQRFYKQHRLLFARKARNFTNSLLKAQPYLVFSVPLLSISINDNIFGYSYTEEEVLTGKRLVEIIKNKVSVIRNKLQKENRSFSQIYINATKGFDILTLNIDNLGLDSIPLVVQWLSVVMDDDPRGQSKGNRSIEVSTHMKDGEVIIQRSDLSAGLVLGYREQWQVKVFKRGFTMQEVDKLLDGYYQHFANRSTTSDFENLDPMNNVFTLFKQLGVDGIDSLLIPLKVPTQEKHGQQQSRESSPSNTIQELERLGVEVFDRKQNTSLTWENLAGYEDVKQHIEETVVNAYKYPDIYDSITKQTRVVFESNRPKAILLEGLPGTGKTLTARILASRCDKTFVHLKMDSIVSKWYGESEKNLAKVFDLCDELDGAIIFIDEVDSIASSRDDMQMHEATRHLLSVILQRIEGFHGKGKSLLVCATNRMHALDAALLSRFDLSIHYELPDFNTRKAVYRYYAKQLAKDDKGLSQLAAMTEGFSSRDLKETCEFTERRWSSRKIRKDSSLQGELPAIQDYVQAIDFRKSSIYGQKAHGSVHL
jgi:SpoVK/Ycf46/Vps4 family AAA+-type ATPase